ncbi:MAG: hypothetical protein HYV92_15000 [Candidatus Rokubacteria bacterium]|nr:hypothetical protein [Candidatus Rokubacteria bacterium]MBI2555692.1 hypothetical protein [Candidatus Rokubacteria bacterium]
MAPRPGMYRGDRRRKEEARKAKQEAKRQRRLERKESGASGPEIEALPDPAQQAEAPAEYVWFSPSKNRTLTTRTAAQPAIAGIDDWILLTEPPKPPAS